MEDSSEEAAALKARLEAGERLAAQLHTELDEPGTVLSALAGGAFLVAVAAWVIEYSIPVGALLSAALVIGFVWLMRGATTSIGTTWAFAAFLLVGLWLAILIAAEASYSLHTFNLAEYSLSGPASMEQFMRLYFFTLVDLVPAIRIPETLHVSSPVEPEDFTAGLPVFAFKCVVVWALFEAFASWRKQRKAAGLEKPGQFVFLIAVVMGCAALVLHRLT